MEISRNNYKLQEQEDGYWRVSSNNNYLELFETLSEALIFIKKQ